MEILKHSVVSFVNQDADLFDMTGKLQLSADIYIGAELTEIYCEEMVDPRILVSILLGNKHFRKQELVDRPIRVFIGDDGNVGRVSLLEETEPFGDIFITGKTLLSTFNGNTNHVGPCSATEVIKAVKAYYGDGEECPHPKIIRKRLEKKIGLKYIKVIDVL